MKLFDGLRVPWWMRGIGDLCIVIVAGVAIWLGLELVTYLTRL